MKNNKLKIEMNKPRKTPVLQLKQSDLYLTIYLLNEEIVR